MIINIIIVILILAPWSILFGLAYLVCHAVQKQLNIQKNLIQWPTAASLGCHSTGNSGDVSTINPETEARLRKKIAEAQKDTGITLVDADYIAGKGNS